MSIFILSQQRAYLRIHVINNRCNSDQLNAHELMHFKHWSYMYGKTELHDLMNMLCFQAKDYF